MLQQVSKEIRLRLIDYLFAIDRAARELSRPSTAVVLLRGTPLRAQFDLARTGQRVAALDAGLVRQSEIRLYRRRSAACDPSWRPCEPCQTPPRGILLPARANEVPGLGNKAPGGPRVGLGRDAVQRQVVVVVQSYCVRTGYRADRPIESIRPHHSQPAPSVTRALRFARGAAWAAGRAGYGGGAGIRTPVLTSARRLWSRAQKPSRGWLGGEGSNLRHTG